MVKEIFRDSEIRYLTLEQAGQIHSIWRGKNIDIPLNAISPEELINLLGMDADDDWIEWLMISNPIVLVEKQLKNTSKSEEQVAIEVQYYRIMGHSTFHYVVRYLVNKYGSNILKRIQFPMTIIKQKKLSKLQNMIFNNELVFSFLLQKSKEHRDLMQAHLLSSPYPISQINSQRKLSKFAKISHSYLSPSSPKKEDDEITPPPLKEEGDEPLSPSPPEKEDDEPSR